MQKILIVTDTFFTKRDLIRFGLKNLDKKFHLSFVSVVKVFNKSFFLKNKKNYRDKILQKYFKSIQEIDFFCQHNKDIKLIIDFMSINENNIKIRKIFKIYNIKTLRYETGALPEKNHFITTKRNFKKFNFLKILIKVINHIKFLYMRKKNFSLFNYILVSGIITDKKYSGKKIYAHSHDYETYLNTKKNIKKNKNFAVFLDEMIPNAPDYKLFNLYKPISYDEYWIDIVRVLKNIEEKFKLEIIICLHPKNYRKNKYIKNFKVNIGKTSDLIQQSKLVIMHSTTAINYAIINKKPLLFINSKKYSWLTDRINFLSKTINGSIIFLEKNFSSQIKKSKIFTIDKKKYNLYSNNYIKHPLSENQSLGSIVSKLALNL